jgi:hypothetical protein
MVGCFGKSMAVKQNYVSVDKNQVDAQGIPIPVIHFQFVENDQRLWQGMKAGLQQITSQLSAEVFLDESTGPGGFASHEVGPSAWGKIPRLPP